MMKLRMDNESLAEGFFEDARMLGIVAPIRDYQLCWQFNQVLQTDFRINNELEIELNRKQRHYFFSVFEYHEPHCTLCHYLYNNQYDGEYLLPEFKHLDYLWLLKGDEVTNDELISLQQSIRSIHAVQMVMELTVNMIRNKGHLIF